MLYMDCPGLPTQEGCSSTGPRQPGAAKPMEVTGQSGQSKLHTVGEHRPGGPVTAGAELGDSDVRRACSYNALHLGPEPRGSGPVATRKQALSGWNGHRWSPQRSHEPTAVRTGPGRTKIQVCAVGRGWYADPDHGSDW